MTVPAGGTVAGGSSRTRSQRHRRAPSGIPCSTTTQVCRLSERLALGTEQRRSGPSLPARCANRPAHGHEGLPTVDLANDAGGDRAGDDRLVRIGRGGRDQGPDGRAVQGGPHDLGGNHTVGAGLGLMRCPWGGDDRRAGTQPGKDAEPVGRPPRRPTAEARELGREAVRRTSQEPLACLVGLLDRYRLGELQPTRPGRTPRQPLVIQPEVDPSTAPGSMVTGTPTGTGREKTTSSDRGVAAAPANMPPT
jgi:hypothetical protein